MEYELGDLIHNTIDYRGKTPKRFDSGIPVLSAANVKKGKIKIDSKFISKEYYDKWATRGFIKPGDILITTEAPVGEIAKVPGDQIYMISRRVFALQINEKLADETYVYYLLLTEGVLKYFESISHGATAPRIYKDEVLKLKINLPELPTQKKIASTLSSYDDLIENNNQRITLLEDMAAEIYKEWFVRFRFPNYQNTKFLDKDGKEVAHGTKGAIPEGWNDGEILDLVELKKGKIITKSTITEGDIPVVAGGLTPAYYHNKANTNSPTITISSSGANAGFVNMYYEDIWVSDCSYLDSKMTNWLFFFYCTFKTRQKEVFHLQRGAAQPHVYSKDIHKLKMKCPPEEILNDFEKLIKPFFQEIDTLIAKNQILQETRDLLLPRLISGKLSVENLEVEEMNSSAELSRSMAAEPQEKYSK
ncbi:restriction endonuclease subunit S [Psychroserpens sp. NJDZ02]|uniref:restriction endonuclease subunit S n=1 Tax=Psychroserpens sp. NJDZ02 TaxID=2570561 RepID=UPI0010A75C46|nr:restriction endonuclease subunit S [Psychroserpens sp. NJDZ02]QCE42391.1 hypothetical protein E9099_13580 [Psychroserpens sp. NJDZ02]